MIGKTINNYVIERKLGEGGMGNVYFARHNRVDRMVAIKVLHQDLFTNESIRNRFKNEANALIKLVHPNIVKIYDYVEQDNFACLVMEYIEGYTLDDYITKVSGPLVTEKAIPVICSVLDAVQYAHDNNIFHRDIKPGNIMVSKDGTIVRIMDFGIAKIIDNENFKATKANTQLGTPFYMSPEQVKGLPYTAASDIYSLGVTLYEIVTGKCPYHAITNLFELQSKIVNEPLPPTAIFYPDVPAHLQAAITKATQKDPSKRFSTCTAFKDFLLSETKPKTEDPQRQAVKKPTKSPPAQPVKAVVENKSEPARQPAAQTVEINKISAPNLLAAYPEKERKSKAWIFILAIFIVMIFGAFFLIENKKDRDGDGIADVDDKCPDVFGLILFNGCTDPKDSDGDGVPDSTDSCPGIAGLGSLKGCPDRDNDGIADKNDDCPDSAGEVSLKGCPDKDKDGIPYKDDKEKDRDDDGVPDSEDKCPDDKGTLKGCPDRDGDGVADKDDNCPDQAGSIKNKGCFANNCEPIEYDDVLKDALNAQITCNGEIFTNREGQKLTPKIPSTEEQCKSEFNNIIFVTITAENKCKISYQFIYEKSGAGFVFIKKIRINQ